MKYNLDGDDEVKLKLFGQDANREKSFWLQPVDLYLVCLNRTFFC
jgi:hypothetical protein